jgi:hypothetical protein
MASPPEHEHWLTYCAASNSPAQWAQRASAASTAGVPQQTLAPTLEAAFRAGRADIGPDELPTHDDLERSVAQAWSVSVAAFLQEVQRLDARSLPLFIIAKREQVDGILADLVAGVGLRPGGDPVERRLLWEGAQAAVVARSQLLDQLRAIAPEELEAWCSRTRAMLDQAAARSGLSLAQLTTAAADAPRAGT